MTGGGGAVVAARTGEGAAGADVVKVAGAAGRAALEAADCEADGEADGEATGPLAGALPDGAEGEAGLEAPREPTADPRITRTPKAAATSISVFRTGWRSNAVNSPIPSDWSG